MTHDEAVGTHATERYFLKEMTGSDRDAFEEHFFECTVCAGDVKAGAAFTAGLRAVPRHADRFAAARSRRAFVFPLAAAAGLLVALLAYQQVGVVGPLRRQVDDSRHARVVTEVDLGTVRGAHDAVINDRSAPFTLYVEVPPEDSAPRHTATIADSQGRIRQTLTITEQDAPHHAFHILVPAGALEPGEYTLRVDTMPNASQHRFTVR